MDVKMPDGTIIQNVPDDITQAELLSRYQKFSAPQSAVSDVPVPSLPGQETGQNTYQPEPAAPRTFYEKLFGKPGTKLAPGAEPIKWAVDNPDVVGATVASLLAPEIAVPAGIAKFGPAVSQLFSQTAARVPAAFMGGTAGNMSGRVAGSVKSDPNAEISDILLDDIKAGGRMATAEATGAMFSPVVSKLFAPGASSFTSQSDELLQFAQQRNIPTAPSTFSQNNTAKATEGTLDAFFPSRLVNDSYRKKAVTRFNQLMTEIPEEVGPIQGNKVITPKAMDEIGGLLKASKMAGKDLSEEFIETIGRDTPVKVSNTKAILAKVNKTATDSALREWVEVKSGQLKGKVTAEDLETALRQVGGIKAKGDKKFLEDIRTAIKADFEAAGAPMEKLAASNTAFKDNYGLTSPKFVKEIQAEIARGGDGTNLTVRLFRDGNEPFLIALDKEANKHGGKISKETWDSLRAQNLQNMILNSSTESQRVPGLRMIDGNKLEKILDANKGALEAAYKDAPKTIQAMRNLARLAKANAGDAKEFEKGLSESFKMGNIGLAGTAGAALKFGDSATGGTGLIIGTATAPLLAKSLMNPNGWAKQWLTTGFEPVRTMEGLRFGTKVATDAIYGED